MKEINITPGERSEWLKQKSGKGLFRLSDEADESGPLAEKRVRELHGENNALEGSVITDPDAQDRIKKKDKLFKLEKKEEIEAQERVINLRKSFK